MGDRLSWYPMWVDDFKGGTDYFTREEIGVYILMLNAQWASRNLQGIPNDSERLQRILRGDLPAVVREKFEEVEIEGRKYFRNQRLATEWKNASSNQQAFVKRAKKAAQARFKHLTPSPSPSPSPSPHTQPSPESPHNPPEGGAAARKKPRAPTQQPDGEWLDSLQDSPAYSRIVVRLEFSKCERWWETNKGRPPSRRAFLNWLNRVEQPMAGQNGKYHYEPGVPVLSDVEQHNLALLEKRKEERRRERERAQG